MASCCVTNCDVTRNHNPNKYTFYRFPIRPELYKKWIHAVSLEDQTVTKNTMICSRHFDQRCFRIRNNKRLLLRDSMPTLCLPIKVKHIGSRSARLPNIQVQKVVPPMYMTSSTVFKSHTETKLVIRNQSLKQKLMEKTKAYKSMKQKTVRMQKRITSLKQVIKDLLKNITNGVKKDTPRKSIIAKNNYEDLDGSD